MLIHRLRLSTFLSFLRVLTPISLLLHDSLCLVAFLLIPFLILCSSRIFSLTFSLYFSFSLKLLIYPIHSFIFSYIPYSCDSVIYLFIYLPPITKAQFRISSYCALTCMDCTSGNLVCSVVPYPIALNCNYYECSLTPPPFHFIPHRDSFTCFYICFCILLSPTPRRCPIPVCLMLRKLTFFNLSTRHRNKLKSFLHNHGT